MSVVGPAYTIYGVLFYFIKYWLDKYKLIKLSSKPIRIGSHLLVDLQNKTLDIIIKAFFFSHLLVNVILNHI